MINKIKGIAASAGISISSAYILFEPNFSISDTCIADKPAEIEKYNQIVEQTKQQLESIKEIATRNIGADKAEVFDAHLQIVADPDIFQDIKNLIEEKSVNLAYAIDTVLNKHYENFKNMNDAYFKERAADIVDIKKRLLSNLLHLPLPNIFEINKEVIIVAKDLSPSQTAILNKQYIKGFITQIGGKTSHTAIMARTLEIPAVVGVADCFSLIKQDDVIGIDGSSGEVVINPDKQEWINKQQAYLKQKEELKAFINQPTITLDNHRVKVEANIGNPKDVSKIIQNGAEGVGLFRSEFLYMDNDHWPTEQEQYEAYKSVLEALPDKEIIIRTLDIGGDKKLPYYSFPDEMNPFLGYRAIRFCLDNIDIFKTQLRALGRASVHGRLCIMFPMIATIDEFKKAKAIALQTFEELNNEGFKVSDNIQIGAMVEIPSTASLAEIFGKYCDFFSIGTNDLNQYTFACDRMSQKVAYLYQPNNPSILRLIKATIAGSHVHGKVTGMCGEMASDSLSVPILLGLGLDAFSVSATSIPKTRWLINKLSYRECQELANEAIMCETTEDVNNLVMKFLKDHNINL